MSNTKHKRACNGTFEGVTFAGTYAFCPHCHTLKKAEEFGLRVTANTLRIQSWCITCRKDTES